MYINSETPGRLGSLVQTDQLVIDVLKLMISTNEYQILIYDAKACVGSITLEEIIKFLSRADEAPLLYHKLNYEMRALIA
jgi:predicted transcriptional regulator